MMQVMNTSNGWLAGICAALFASVTLAANTDGESWNIVNLGMRMHSENETFVGDKQAFGDHDLAYKIGYEYHEASAFWQLAANWTPSATGAADTDWAVTPEMNLLFKDGWVRAGAGVLIDYLARGDGGSDWTSVYWQFLAGVGIPLGSSITLDGYVYYPFADWTHLNQFDVSALEYGINLGYKF